MLDVWYTLSPPRVALCLGRDEAQRRERFLCERAREDYGLAHSLKRRVLSHYAPGRAPQSWEFVHGPAGKPAVAGDFAHRFNLSHSGPCVAVAVADCEVGVDIERHRPLAAVASLAERVFHPREQAWLAAQPAHEDAFFRLWTLKEALLKAAGTGFSHPPQQAEWEGLDTPRPQAGFAGRRWSGFSRRVGSATLAAAVPADAQLAQVRWLQVGAHDANDAVRALAEGMATA